MYKATTDTPGDGLAIKFATTYNAAAHRLLASEGLAPVLHYSGTEDRTGTMFGGRSMIIMDFFDSGALLGYISVELFKQITRAVELLHSRDFVFGDLRPPNILIKDGMVKLIDFDWCSKEGEGYYSANLNEAIEWPAGVGPGLKEHDQAWLQLIEKYVNK
jgi:serine/threonine protein kinase